MARRLPARARILVTLLALGAVHAAFSQPIEAFRVRALVHLPHPGGPGGLLRPGAGPPAEPDLPRRVAAWRALRTKGLRAAGRVPVAVIDYRPKAQIAIIGAGRGSGLDVGDPVVVPAGLLGFIDAAEEHLARVRLLSAPGARVAVTLAESRRGLPGGLSTLNAVLEGTGEGARLVLGSLLTEFRPGDRLTAVLDGAPATALPIGSVATAGPVPAVDLFAGPGDLGFVAVPADREPAVPLFSDAPLLVVAAPSFGGSGALLAGGAAAAVGAGCAVQAEGRYLGRVVLASGTGAVASRLADRGHRVFVRWLAADGRSATGQLVSTGGGRFRLESAAVVRDDASLLAVTAGGQDLVPADLAVGSLEKDGGDWRLRDPVVDWPSAVTVPAFAFPGELRQLLPR